MHYLITGHTGFKGAWLTLLLASRGHEVSGLSLDPVQGSLFDVANLAEIVTKDLRVDIRDAASTASAVALVNPDAVIHLAAQPLVRESYRDPRATFETNVMGTLNVLDAVGTNASVRAQLIVTTDKVYRNVNQHVGYVESDPLGGHDPYSSSKAMADILTHSWVASFPGPLTAIARAGNVIGGGDVSVDRLLPDLLRSFQAGRPAVLRYPDAVRPWQHVLDCLQGYVMLVDDLIAGRGAGEWNFGPGIESFVPVRDVADSAARRWGEPAEWSVDPADHLHEAELLALDASKATNELGWHTRLKFPTSLDWTVDWHREVMEGADPREVTIAQITQFEKLP